MKSVFSGFAIETVADLAQQLDVFRRSRRFFWSGHQISLHLGQPFVVANTGKVGNHMVPMPHLGVILLKPDWMALAERLKAANTRFVLEPQVRFEGEPGEQWTMFFHDPSGNPIEVKGFARWEAVYEH